MERGREGREGKGRKGARREGKGRGGEVDSDAQLEQGRRLAKAGPGGRRKCCVNRHRTTNVMQLMPMVSDESRDLY